MPLPYSAPQSYLQVSVFKQLMHMSSVRALFRLPASHASWKWLGRHFRGHVFLFDAKPLPTYDSSTGLRMLLIFLLLEAIVGPRLSLFDLLGLPVPPAWLRVPILLGLALILIRFFARLRLGQIGLYPWRNWSGTEKSYFIQAFLIANAVFGILYAGRSRMIGPIGRAGDRHPQDLGADTARRKRSSWPAIFVIKLNNCCLFGGLLYWKEDAGREDTAWRRQA